MVGPVEVPSLTPGSRAVKPPWGEPQGAPRRAAPSTRLASPLAAPIKKTRIAEEIADRIRQLILDRTFAPGQPLPSERLLAAQLGVSRGSVRDAFRMLETIGLLEARHGQGTFPHELSLDRLITPLVSVLAYRRDLQDELVDVRRMFEPAVAQAAAARASEQDLADLGRIVARQRQKLKSGQSAISEDTAFHAVLARSTNNRVVVQIMETLNAMLVDSRKLTLRQKGRPERSVRGHEAVIAALHRRDADGAGRAMRAHINQIGELLHAAPPPPGAQGGTPGAPGARPSARRGGSPGAPGARPSARRGGSSARGPQRSSSARRAPKRQG